MNSRVSLMPAPRFVGTAVEPTMSAPNVIRSQSSGGPPTLPSQWRKRGWVRDHVGWASGEVVHRGRQRGTASGRAPRRPLPSPRIMCKSQGIQTFERVAGRGPSLLETGGDRSLRVSLPAFFPSRGSTLESSNRPVQAASRPEFANPYRRRGE